MKRGKALIHLPSMSGDNRLIPVYTKKNLIINPNTSKV